MTRVIDITVIMVWLWWVIMAYSIDWKVALIMHTIMVINVAYSKARCKVLGKCLNL